MAEDKKPRQSFEFNLTTVERGKIRLKLYDRIGIDDVTSHLINRELFRIITGEDSGDEVNQFYKDYLLKERFTPGQ